VHEPNDTKVIATSLAPMVEYVGSVCASDVDWYALDLSEGQNAVVVMAFANSNGNIDALMLNPALEVVASDTGTLDGIAIAAEATESGVHYLQVFGATSSVTNVYILQLSVF